MHEVTRILSQLEAGDAQAADQLLPLVYEELRGMAARQLAAEQAGHTLSPTALVHEAYLRLVGSRTDGEKEGRSDGENGHELTPSVCLSLPPSVPAYNSRGHFFCAAAESMRRILVDFARRKRALKRGGAAVRLPLDEAGLSAPEPNHDLLALDEALARLEQEQQPLAELVKLRYFAGLTMPQAAEALGIPLRTAERNWTYAKAWLLQAIAAKG